MHNTLTQMLLHTVKKYLTKHFKLCLDDNILTVKWKRILN